MLNPGGSLSLAVGNLSAAAGSGGGATGASFAAAGFPSGRPINGEPGGSGAAGAAAGGDVGVDAGGCWAKAGAATKTPAIVPASKIERSTVNHAVIECLPNVEALDSRGGSRTSSERSPLPASLHLSTFC